MKLSFSFTVLSLIALAVPLAALADNLAPLGSSVNPVYVEVEPGLSMQLQYLSNQYQQSIRDGQARQQGFQNGLLNLSYGSSGTNYYQQPQIVPVKQFPSATGGGSYAPSSSDWNANDFKCKSVFGPQSYFGGRYIADGYPACDCNAGYEIKGGICASVLASVNQTAGAGEISIKVANEGFGGANSGTSMGGRGEWKAVAPTPAEAIVAASASSEIMNEVGTGTDATTTPPAPSKTVTSVFSIFGILVFMAGVLRFLA